MTEREPFDWPRAMVAMLAGALVVVGVKVAEIARRIWRRASR